MYNIVVGVGAGAAIEVDDTRITLIDYLIKTIDGVAQRHRQHAEEGGGILSEKFANVAVVANSIVNDAKTIMAQSMVLDFEGAVINACERLNEKYNLGLPTTVVSTPDDLADVKRMFNL